MRRKRVPVTVLAAALSACAVESESLNSERIERQFGSYGIELLSSQDGIRRSNLYSHTGKQKTCRTYAVVHFDNVPDGILSEEHAQIVAGHSIGEIFKARGWSIYKETRYVGEFRLPSGHHPVLQLMARDGMPMLAMHVYRLLLKKQSQVVEYAMIIELHHPDYLNREQLAELYVVDEPVRLSEDELHRVSALVESTDW